MSAGTIVPGTTAGDSLAFIAALEALDLEGIKRVPKADLHNHSGLGMRYASFARLIPTPPPAPATFKGLPPFLAWTGSVMRPYARDPLLMPRMVRAAIEDAIEDGVAVLETSFDLNVGKCFGPPEAYAALARSLKEGYSGRIELKPEIGVKKAADEKAEGDYIAALIDSGAFESIDLYGAELHPWRMGKWKDLFRRARARGLKPKAHFGEFEGPFGIPRLAGELGIRTIQHGIGLARSRRALEWARKADIACNVCPASNLALGAAPSLKAHPIRRMFDAGVRVTIATDDLLCFGMSVSEQFLALRREGVFSSAELDGIRITGLTEGFSSGN